MVRKIAEVLLDARRMAEIKIVKHGGVRKNLLYLRIPAVGEELVCARDPTTVTIVTQ